MGRDWPTEPPMHCERARFTDHGYLELLLRARGGRHLKLSVPGPRVTWGGIAEAIEAAVALWLPRPGPNT